jgi:hypothetical protein
VQGLNLTVIHTGTTEGTGVCDHGQPIYHRNRTKGTIILTDPAAYTLFRINNEHILLSYQVESLSSYQVEN